MKLILILDECDCSSRARGQAMSTPLGVSRMCTQDRLVKSIHRDMAYMSVCVLVERPPPGQCIRDRLAS